MLRCYRFLASVLFFPALLLGLPFILLWPRGRLGLGERLGWTRCPEISGEPRFWIHAASLGEVKTCAPLLSALRQRYPDSAILLTATTPSGRQVARKDFRGWERLALRLLPIEVPFLCRRLLSAFRPNAVVVIETEFWPAFFSEVKRFGAALILANGRISPLGERRVRPFRLFYRAVLACVDRFYMRSQADYDRLTAIDPSTPARSIVAGNLKYDALTRQPMRDDFPPALISLLGSGRWLLLASTHEG